MIFCFVKDEKPLQWIRVAFKFIPSCKLHLCFCANINYLFEFIFSPENAKKLSKPLLYINMHQDSEHNSSNHAAHTAEVERNCCSEYHRSAVIPILVEDARIAHACAIVYWKMFAKSLRYTSIRAGKWRFGFEFLVRSGFFWCVEVEA